MRSAWTKRFWQCLLLLGVFTNSHALTFDVKSVKLSADQRASLKRFIAEASPTLSFDWNSLEANANSIGGKRQPLSATMSTMPALTAAGVCRIERHHFYAEAGTGSWNANVELTSRQAWVPRGFNCTPVSSLTSVGRSLTDAEFVFIEREKDVLKSRAAQVIGGSDCARVRFCEVTLGRINRVRQESPSRILTKLTYTPSKPGLSAFM